MTTALTITEEQIAAFAVAVREQLDDLPADEVDDLLDGLEADLVEQASDRGDEFALPDAAAYADELRSAAGLPERMPPGDAVRPAWYRHLAEDVRARAHRTGERVRANPAGRWLIDFAVSLRPVWWVLRGLVLFFCLAVTLGIPVQPGSGSLAWLLAAALVVLSVQWGRGRWLPYRWVRGIRSVISGVTAIVGVLLLVAAPTVVPGWLAGSASVNEVYVDSTQPGLSVDGVRVRNIFAYDADGNPIDAVQLYNQDGQPLTTTGIEARMDDWDYDMYYFGGGGPVPVPVTGVGRQNVWNVFPLRELPSTTWEDDADPDTARVPTFPFAEVPALRDDATTPTPEPTPAPTPAPSAAPDAAPTPDAAAPDASPAP